jgi:hypothetical protein
MDDNLARRSFADYLNTFRYDDWDKPPIQIIDPEHSSKYVERIVAEALRRRTLRLEKGRSTHAT